jgi:succinyl-CoA synthetase alpha subunit
MGILLDENTAVAVVGITGGRARIDTVRDLEYGTNIVCGVAPRRGGQQVAGVPVYDSCALAAQQHQIDAVVAYLPPAAYVSAMRDVLAVRPSWVHVVTEGIPLHDNVRILNEARAAGVRIVGPNTSGIITPGHAKVGFLAHTAWMIGPGRVGILSRSGGFTHDLAYLVSQAGLGVSTAIPIGGDSVVGQSFADLLELFEADEGTDATVIYGEAGPPIEAEVAERVRAGTIRKPVVALICGDFLDDFAAGTVFGHAGAFLDGPESRAEAKRALLREAGVHVVDSPRQIVGALHGAGVTSASR